MSEQVKLLRRLTAAPWPAALVALAPLVYFLPATLGRIILCPDDGMIQNLPLRAAAARMALDGHLPLWNPYIFGGTSLLGAAQGGPLLPLNWLHLLLPPQAATNLLMLASYALAGLGAYLYARRAGADARGALTTGLVFQFGGFLVAQLGHTNIVQSAAMLPWLLWSIEAYAATNERRRGLLVAAFVALQAFAGHQQTLAYSLALACAYAVWMASRGERGARRAYLFALLLLAAGLALSAVQILPTAELARNSLRAEATYDFFTSFSMPPAFLLTFFAPYVTGGGDGTLFRAHYVGPEFYAEYVGYVGATALALAVLAALLRRDAVTRFWTAAALVALALALGRFLPFDLYRLVYYVPVFNLFRVPARHLMEVDFALAVLAGRAVSAVPAWRGRRRETITCVAVALAVFALTCLAVTAWRPENFRLGREAPVTFLRAPELFVPVALAALSAWALWRLIRGRRLAFPLLVALVVFELVLWGHTSGWRVRSPSAHAELWRVPPVVEFLREREGRATGAYRILTTPAPFFADAPRGRAAAADPPARLVLAAQPDLYMMHGVENAAGYDGFGLARYSRLAGDMKLWGELTDPEATLLGDGRAVDLLNVRYLVTPTTSAAYASELPRATLRLGPFMFAAQDLGLPYLENGARAHFRVPGVAATRVAVVTNLAWSAEVPDGEPVGRIVLRDERGREFPLTLRAGFDTSEWAHEREARGGKIRHRLAPVATSASVTDAGITYESHTYVTSFELPARAVVVGATLEVERRADAPKLGLGVQRVTLLDETNGAAVPLAKRWLDDTAKGEAAGETKTNEAGEGKTGESDASQNVSDAAGRWRRLAQAGEVVVYENTRALPRAWLASEVVELADEAKLEVIRTGRLPDGRAWEPLRTALADIAPPFAASDAPAERRAEVTRHEPNRVDVRTSSTTPSVLVLAENHYPGWRAYVDGRSQETMRVNYNQRGLLLAPGEHDVRFLFRPKSFYIGLLVALAAVLALAAWAWRWPEEKLRRVFSNS